MIQFILDNRRWLGAGALLTFGTCWGQTFFISIFADEIMTHYRISDGQWGAIYAAGTMASGILMIFTGALADRFHPRPLALGLLALLAVFCLGMALNRALWLLPILIFGLRFCGQGMLNHTAHVAIARWFTANRGKAISIAGLGFASGEAFLPLIVVAALALITWQKIWLVAAVLCGVYMIGVILLFARDREHQIATINAGSPGMAGRHWTRAEAMGHPLFWAISALVFSQSALGTAIFFQQAHLAEVKGWTHASFTALFPLFTATAVISGLAYGWAIDRFGSLRLVAVFLIPLALAFGIFWISDRYQLAVLAMMLFGLMAGGGATLLTTIWAEAFGTDHIGAIKAASAAVMVIGSAVGPFISGLLIDQGLNFDDQMPIYILWILAVTGVAALICKQAGPALAPNI